MTHSELCRLTAEWVIKPPAADWLALYEYQSFATQEFPDVLSYSATGTRLYEIKTSHADFLADQKKEARVCRGSYWMHGGLHAEIDNLWSQNRKQKNALFIDKKFDRKIRRIDTFFTLLEQNDKTYQEPPHLGERRYYVCEPGIIDESELPTGWGLIYFDGKKFKEIRDSSKWKPNVRAERDIMAHALRRYASGDDTGILIHTYGQRKINQDSSIQKELAL